jgi:NagD protein
MVTAMTGKRAKVLGKPSRIAFDAAARAMGIGTAAAKNIVVVGDDPSLEMRMANGAGAVSIGMTTGLMKRETADALSPAETPMALLDSLEPMLKALR